MSGGTGLSVSTTRVRTFVLLLSKESGTTTAATELRLYRSLFMATTPDTVPCAWRGPMAAATMTTMLRRRCFMPQTYVEVSIGAMHEILLGRFDSKSGVEDNRRVVQKSLIRAIIDMRCT